MGNGRLRCNIHRGIRHAHAHSRQALRKWQARSGNGSGLDQIHPAARGCRQGRLRGVANAESGKRQRLYESTERLLHELSPCVPRENTLCEAIVAMEYRKLESRKLAKSLRRNVTSYSLKLVDRTPREGLNFVQS